MHRFSRDGEAESSSEDGDVAEVSSSPSADVELVFVSVFVFRPSDCKLVADLAIVNELFLLLNCLSKFGLPLFSKGSTNSTSDLDIKLTFVLHSIYTEKKQYFYYKNKIILLKV